MAEQAGTFNAALDYIQEVLRQANQSEDIWITIEMTDSGEPWKLSAESADGSTVFEQTGDDVEAVIVSSVEEMKSKMQALEERFTFLQKKRDALYAKMGPQHVPPPELECWPACDLVDPHEICIASNAATLGPRKVKGGSNG